MKRRRSSNSSEASFVTADSQAEREPVLAPQSLKRVVSPPPTNRLKSTTAKPKSATAAVEAGEVTVKDHVAFFSEKLLAARRPEVQGRPQLSHPEWLELYRRNLSDSGHHFVVHQHDHPVAGTHYDLRLQCNATSSISFAIMYGLPGDPNSRRLNRNATETRVHNLWNHLIETASHETGTLLIWDTGEYEVLPYLSDQRNRQGSDTESDSESSPSTNTPFSAVSEPEKLAHSFARRKIRLRLHGTRLPPNYTIGMRLTLDNFRSSQPKPPTFKRKRKDNLQPAELAPRPHRLSTSSSSSSSATSDTTNNSTHGKIRRTVSSLQRTASPPSRKPISNPSLKTTDSVHSNATHNEKTFALASEDEGDESETIRLTNAYPGATNTINSIHQRKWYLSLDRSLSGFTPIPTPSNVNHHAKTYWVRAMRNDGSKAGFEKFHVLGRDVERSVLTGRLAGDVLADEGVVGYLPRGRWRGVVE